jgi:hypothetical protein
VILILTIDSSWRNKKYALVASIRDFSKMRSSNESVVTLLRIRNEKRPRNFAGDTAYSGAQ